MLVDHTVATGADIAITVPPGNYWRPLSLCFKYATDLNGANRYLRYAIKDEQGNYISISHTATAITASKNVVCSWSCNLGDERTSTTTLRSTITMPWPITLKPGWSVVTEILNMQIGDSITAVNFNFEPVEKP